MKRNWKNKYEGAKRLRVLKQALMIASIVQGFPGWFRIVDVWDVYQAEVGTISERTIARYLATLEMSGLLEVSLTKHPIRYRWDGWPEPLRKK